MNEKKYLSYLERYHQWLKAHQEKEYDLYGQGRIQNAQKLPDKHNISDAYG